MPRSTSTDDCDKNYKNRVLRIVCAREDKRGKCAYVMLIGGRKIEDDDRYGKP
jgi:hypothetical protein